MQDEEGGEKFHFRENELIPFNPQSSAFINQFS